MLAGEAPELVPFYPCLGGEEPPEQAWPVLRSVIERHVAELRPALEVAPQTNEVGRAAALLVGLFVAFLAARSTVDNTGAVGPGRVLPGRPAPSVQQA